MQPAKRTASDLVVCGAPAKRVPGPPGSNDDADKSSLLKAFEAIVAAGRLGLLGPAARAAVEAMPDLEGSAGKAGRDTPSPPVPLVEEKKEEEEEKKEETKENKKEMKEEMKKGKIEEKKEEGKKYKCITVCSYTPPVAGTESSNPYSKEIWIIGDSVISLLTKRAEMDFFFIQLDLPSCTTCVTLRGCRNMMWDDLLPVLHSIYHERPFPSIIIIHLGGNDLWRDNINSLVTKMQNDLGLLQRALPDVLIIWSSLLPKPLLAISEELKDIESKRSYVNSKMEEYCTKNGIWYLSHPLFTVENKELFLNGPPLTDKGVDTFVTDLKEILHTNGIHKKC